MWANYLLPSRQSELNPPTLFRSRPRLRVCRLPSGRDLIQFGKIKEAVGGAPEDAGFAPAPVWLCKLPGPWWTLG